MFRRYLNVGSVFDVPVRLDAGWFLLVAWMVWALPRFYLEHALPPAAVPYRWAIALLVALLFTGVVVFHELAHAAVARAAHLPPQRITIALFGGALSLLDETNRPGQELAISLAGPATTLLAGLFWGLVYHLAYPAWMLLAAPARALQVICLVLGLFNLLPALPLDGGQALKAILWFLSGDRHAATRWAARFGQYIGTVLTVGSLVMWLRQDAREWVWVTIVGLLVEGGARLAQRQASTQRALEGQVAADAMLRGCVPLDSSLTLDALDDALALRSVPCLIVGDDKVVTGLLTPRRLRKVPRSRRASTTLSEVMLPLNEANQAQPELSLVKVLGRMADQGIEEMPVIRDGALLGVVEHHEIVRLIQTRIGLSPD
jgi:Zn-dependent protease